MCHAHSYQLRDTWDSISPLVSLVPPLLSSPFPPPPGTLLASCTCSASLELPSSVSPDFLTEGAVALLPVPSNVEGVLATSWFRGHEARPETMIFSPEGLPGPGHTGREALGTQGNLVIRNVTAQDAGSYTVVLETRRGRRSETEQIRIKGEWGPIAGGTEFLISKAHRDMICASSQWLTNKPPQSLK